MNTLFILSLIVSHLLFAYSILSSSIIAHISLSMQHLFHSPGPKAQEENKEKRGINFSRKIRGVEVNVCECKWSLRSIDRRCFLGPTLDLGDKFSPR